MHIFVKTILVELNVFVTSLFIVRKVERKKNRLTATADENTLPQILKSD